ncbi:sarcosine oxidase subunit gamma [Celeribacter sp. ULVN23_4]
MSDTLSTRPHGLLCGTSAAQVSLSTPPARLNLRVRDNVAELGQELGLELPGPIGQRAKSGEFEVLCVGPDEWVIVGAETATLIEKSRASSLPHSLVDISGREITFTIEGPGATDLMSIGSPRDPASIKVGEGRRTLFGSSTVVLWRDAETTYRMDIWATFASHMLHLLDTCCRELAAEVH